MSLNTFAPQAHINTQLTEADKIEAMDESGQSRLSQGDRVCNRSLGMLYQSVSDSSLMVSRGKKKIIINIYKNDKRCLIAKALKTDQECSLVFFNR